MRAFVTFLSVSFLFSLSCVISSICLLFTERDYTDRSDLKMYCAGGGILIAIVTFALTVSPRCRNSIRFMTLLIGGFLAIGMTLAFCRDSASIIAGCMIYIAMGYCLVIRSMLFEYIDLVFRHTNVKEKAARL